MTLILSIAAFGLLLALAAQAWALLHLHGQHDRMRRRLETLSALSDADEVLNREVASIRRLTASIFAGGSRRSSDDRDHTPV